VNLAIFLGIAIAVRAGSASYEDVFLWGWVWRLDFRPWTLVTSVFLHDPSGLWHVGFNMLFLWVFGQAVETRLGSWWFLVFYLVGGAFASVAHMFASVSPAIGASGAVAAVSGAYLALFPRSTVRVFAFFPFYGIHHIPATWFILFYVAIDLLSQASEALGGLSDVAHAAHLGGYLFGFSTAMVLLGTGILPRTEFDAFFLAKQWRRRRELRRVVDHHGSGFDAPSTTAPVPRRVRESKTPGRPTSDPDAPRRAAIIDALRRDDGETAIREFKASPPSIRLAESVLADLGNRAMAAGDTESAIRAYTRLLERRGDRSYGDAGPSDEFRLLLATLLVRRAGRPNDARPLLERLATSHLSEASASLRDALLAEIEGASGTP
jgi:membrane associated rhomboid family serine protease